MPEALEVHLEVPIYSCLNACVYRLKLKFSGLDCGVAVVVRRFLHCIDVSTDPRQTTSHPYNMSFGGSSKYDELSLSMAGLRVPAVYKATAFKVPGEPFAFTCPGEMRWEELLPQISKEVKASAQNTSLINTSSDMNRSILSEPIDDIGVWLHKPDAEIEVLMAVTDLRLWYNYFVI